MTSGVGLFAGSGGLPVPTMIPGEVPSLGATEHALGAPKINTYLRDLRDARFASMKERGASAVEYGLLIAGIAALSVVAVFALGPVVMEAFTDTCKEITSSPGTTVTEAECTPA